MKIEEGKRLCAIHSTICSVSDMWSRKYMKKVEDEEEGEEERNQCCESSLCDMLLSSAMRRQTK